MRRVKSGPLGSSPGSSSLTRLADFDGDAVIHEYLLAHKIDCRLCAFVVAGGIGSQLSIEFLEEAGEAGVAPMT